MFTAFNNELKKSRKHFQSMHKIENIGSAFKSTSESFVRAGRLIKTGVLVWSSTFFALSFGGLYSYEHSIICCRWSKLYLRT